MLGGCFTHHPDDHLKVRYDYKNDHVLSHEKASFAIMDEHYFIERVEKNTYFLESLSTYGVSDAGLMNVSVQRDLSTVIRWFK
ncbi:hypothetical protein APU01nite_24100 [Alkalibacterium putridalgicola]|uniref:Uncharacterized protein n=1 Tax=Alkalibacterium putridalgicola TaxID=426703 RepID=A0ABQ0V0N1_9LACT|nr:hypothetical protein APU01nite_24100 [Alkalibacterium putridalgicola]